MRGKGGGVKNPERWGINGFTIRGESVAS